MTGKQQRKDRRITPRDSGFFHDIANQIKLILRLMADPRVNPLLKLLPISTLLYFIFPDLAPGPIDDALIIGIGTYLFVELCPPEIVQEHKDALAKVVTSDWHDPDSADEPEIKAEDILEGEFRDE
jgi:hypothetical protein